MEEIQGIFYTLRKEATNKDPGSFYLGSNGYSGRILCDGIGWNLKKGTPLRVCGEWINRSILHFSVTEIYFDTTQGSACESFFSRSYFKGCGSTSSRMLYSRLCEDKGFKWNEIPVADLAELIRKYHVNEQAIHALAEAIGGIEERKRLRADLKAFEPTYRDLEILYQSYHHGAMVQLKERPYDCLAYGVSFQVCDGVAGEFGNLKAWDVDRITAIHRQLAKKVQSTGSCCIRIDLAIKYLSWLQRNSKFQELSPAFLLSSLFASSDFVITKSDRYGLLIYPKFLFYAERDIVSEIRRLNHTREELPYTGYRGERDLDSYQIAAMEFFHSTGVKILYGGPGSGKTTTIEEFISEYRRLKSTEMESIPVFLCAPTGRAAVRIAESCGSGEKAMTIHKLIGVRPYGSGEMRCEWNKEHQLPKGLFILDEMSMTDELLFLRFLQAIPNGSMVILSGDPDQLPSVNSGTVLRDLIDSNVLETAHLAGNHRQEGGSIVENYKKLQNYDPNLIEDEDFQIIRVQSQTEALHSALNLYHAFYSNDPSHFQILTAVNRGDIGKTQLNQVIVDERAKENPHAMRHGAFCVGDRIMMMRNNYDEGYWNGDVGIITEVLPIGGFRAMFYDGIRLIQPDSVSDMDHAFVMTVHKSQGSEYDIVVYVLDPEYPSMLYRSLFLTAITRARKKVFLITQNDCVSQAVCTDREAERITGLCEMLQKEFGGAIPQLTNQN